ncbi:MAG: cell wall-binding repeat-containing protein [Gracilibacteraceae bacterium]|nr:cell wall-binding repeat-containing protein [Gracilibacteraceae bacterium]
MRGWKTILSKTIALLLVTMLIFGVLPPGTASAYGEGDVDNFISIYPERLNSYLTRHAYDFSYNDFATWLFTSYDQRDPDPDNGSGIMSSFGIIASAYAGKILKLNDASKKQFNDIFKDYVEKFIEGDSVPAELRSALEHILRAVVDNANAGTADQKLSERLIVLLGQTNSISNVNYIVELNYLFNVLATQKGAVTFSSGSTHINSENKGNIDLDAAFDALKLVDFSTYSASLSNGDILSVLPQLAEDLDTLKPFLDAIDALESITYSGHESTIVNAILTGDKTKDETENFVSIADILVEYVAEEVLAGEPALVDLAKAYLQDAHTMADLQAELEGLANLFSDDPDPDLQKATLKDLLAASGILVVDDAGAVLDVDIGKALGYLDIDEGTLKKVLSDTFTRTVKKLNDLALDLQNDTLTLVELEKQAGIIIGGLAGELDALEKAGVPSDIINELKGFLDEKTIIDKAKALVKKLLEDYEDPKPQTMSMMSLFPITPLTDPTTDLEKLYTEFAKLWTANENTINPIIEKIIKELKERGIIFTDPASKQVDAVAKLLKNYLKMSADYLLGEDPSQTPSPLQTKVTAVKIFLNDYLNVSGSEVEEYIINLLDDSLLQIVKDALPSSLSALSAAVPDGDELWGYVFADDDWTLTPAAAKVIAKNYVKAANFINGLIAANTAEVSKLKVYLTKIYNNIHYVADYISGKGLVAITATNENPSYYKEPLYSLATNYDDLVYDDKYKAFIENMGISFRYALDNDNDFEIQGNILYAKAPDATGPVTVTAEAQFKYNSQSYTFSLAQKELLVAIPTSGIEAKGLGDLVAGKWSEARVESTSTEEVPNVTAVIELSDFDGLAVSDLDLEYDPGDGSGYQSLTITDNSDGTGTINFPAFDLAKGTGYVALKVKGEKAGTFKYSIKVKASDNTVIAETEGMATVTAVPNITTTSLLGGTVGAAYKQTLEADGSAPITWSIEPSSGSLPNGLLLNTTTGEIYGTPTTAGMATFTVKAENSAGNNTKQLSIVIDPAPTAPSIITTTLLGGKVGESYSATLTADGDAPITWSVEIGSLPGGLLLNTTTGVIYGTPMTAETATFTVKAENSAGDDSKELSIVIDPALPALTAPTITTTSLLDGKVGESYSKTLAANGDAPITWSVEIGSLPGGLSLNSATGEISGTPTTAETATFTVKAANNAGDATKSLTITITPETSTPPDPPVSGSYSVTPDTTFTAVYYGYDPIDPKPVTISNTGAVDWKNVSLSLEGTDPDAFEILDPIGSFDVDANDTVSVSISPVPGLSAGTYNAVLTVSGSGATRSVALHFTVDPRPVTVTAPVILTPSIGGTPVTNITMGEFTLTVEWEPSHAAFAAYTPYAAKISLPNPNYALIGITNIPGATGGLGYDAVNQTVTAKFPAIFPAPSSDSGGGGGGSIIVTEEEVPLAALPTSAISYIYGADRTETAISISKAGWTSAEAVILAPGDNDHIIDALSVSSLAGQDDIPILLVLNNSIRENVFTEIARLGAGKAYVVGSLGQGVADQLQARFPAMEIIVLQGANRVETAKLINARITAPQGTFVVGYGAVADAVSAASFAAANGYVIQIAAPDAAFGGDSSLGGYVLGGPSLVQDVSGLTRIYGEDRYATNQSMRDSLTFMYDIVYFANGVTLVDALTGSALAAKTRSVVLLTPRNDPVGLNLGPVTPETKVYGFGGPAV